MRVPWNAFGNLEITASEELGDLGGGTSEPVAMNWPLHRHLPRVVPILLLMLVLVPRANRSRAAWAVLIPAVVVYGACLLPAKVGLGALPGELVQVLCDMLTGMALVWAVLLALAFLRAGPGRSRLVSLILALVVGLVAAESVALARVVNGGLTGGGTVVLFGLAFGTGVQVGSLGLACLLCRRRWSARRFLALLTAGFVVAAGLALSPFAVIAVCTAPGMAGAMVVHLVASGVLGGLAAVATVPYVVLIWRSTLYRERLLAVLRLPWSPAPAAPAAALAPAAAEPPAPPAAP